ncbi:hypothetical protein E2974_16070 [Paracoccus yeei]|uniref:phage tail tube protein n=1 Tax=Paracoccus yeei TaxID=147645 RepID=UPI0037D2D51E
MATTILRALPNSDYAEGKGVAHFYPFTNADDPTTFGAGVRLGDMDAMNLAVEMTEGDTRYSNEYDVKTAALTPVSEIDCKLSLTLAQLTETAVASALMGKRAPFTQTAQTGLSKTLAAGEIAFLGGYDVQITEATLVAGGAAQVGVDYMIDAASGQIEAIRAIEIEYSIPAVSDKIKIGIASGVMPRGMLIFRGVAAQGKRRIVRLHDVQLKPAGGLDLISDGLLTVQLEASCYPIAGQEDGYAIGIVTEVDA